MNRSAYYEELKEHARSVRTKYGLVTPRVLKSDLRRVYKDYGIQIDLWPHRMKDLRGAYFNDDLGPTVMLAKDLPDDPMIFTMAHELKHHLVDRDLPVACCSNRNINQHIEIGAEIFAAELIYPEQDFLSALTEKGIVAGSCTPEAIVHLKHETRTTLSYAGLAKRAVFWGLASEDAFKRIQWKKLEEKIFGEPIYKRILRHRRGQ